MIFPKFWEIDSLFSFRNTKKKVKCTHQQTMDFFDYSQHLNRENILRIHWQHWLVVELITCLQPKDINQYYHSKCVVKGRGIIKTKWKLSVTTRKSVFITSGSFPSDTRLRALHPSDPIHENVPVALFLLTARITPATSWSEPKMIAPVKNKKMSKLWLPNSKAFFYGFWMSENWWIMQKKSKDWWLRWVKFHILIRWRKILALKIL